MNELEKLSSKAHIQLRNNFTGFHNTPESTIWILEAEHCTHRGLDIKCKGRDLEDLIKAAMKRMMEIEQHYDERKEAFTILYPEKDEYEIAQLAMQGNKFMNKEQREPSILEYIIVIIFIIITTIGTLFGKVILPNKYMKDKE